MALYHESFHTLRLYCVIVKLFFLDTVLICTWYACLYYTTFCKVPLFVAKIIHVYLFHGILFSLFNISTKIFDTKYFSVWLMKRCTRKCTICLTITFQGYHFYCLVDQCKQNTRILKRNG